MDTSAESDKQKPEETQAEAPATVVEEAQPEESGQVTSKKPLKRLSGKKMKQGTGGRASKKNQLPLQQVKDRFAACGRCSFFWAGYRVIFGEEALATAVAQSASGWLDLAWNADMRELVHKSYGVRLDIDYFHYEGCCKECRRPFVYRAAEGDGEPDSFKIGVSPRTV